MSSLVISETNINDIDTILLMEDQNSIYVTPNSKSEHKDLLLNPNIKHMVLKLEGNRIIGFVILAGLLSKNKSIEFRRIVVTEKGKGYGRLALRAIKRFCFDDIKCHRLWLDVIVTNKRAISLYQSEGFTREGILRDAVLIDGKFKDLVLMSMLEGEWS